MIESLKNAYEQYFPTEAQILSEQKNQLENLQEEFQNKIYLLDKEVFVVTRNIQNKLKRNAEFVQDKQELKRIYKSQLELQKMIDVITSFINRIDQKRMNITMRETMNTMTEISIQGDKSMNKIINDLIMFRYSNKIDEKIMNHINKLMEKTTHSSGYNDGLSNEMSIDQKCEELVENKLSELNPEQKNEPDFKQLGELTAI